MRRLFVLLIVFSSVTRANAQLTLTDVMTIGNSITNAFDVNPRSILSINDTWLANGWIMSAYHRAPPSPNVVNIDVFEYTNTANANEKFVITIFHLISNGKQLMRFEVDATTQDLNEYNSWLSLIRNHPDFTRTVALDNIYTQIYDANPIVGEKQRLIFGIRYNQLQPNPISVQAGNPVVYGVSFIRPFAP